MKLHLDRVFISSCILTACLLSLVPADLRFAATWRTRQIPVMDRVYRLNYESDIAFASLALVVIGLIVIWSGFQRKMPWSWVVMAVFVCVYFVPVYLLDVFLDIKRVGWSWWIGVIRDAREGYPFAQLSIRLLLTFAFMALALFLPLQSFSGFRTKVPSLTESR